MVAVMMHGVLKLTTVYVFSDIFKSMTWLWRFSKKVWTCGKVKIFQNPSCYILEKINENYDKKNPSCYSIYDEKKNLAIMMH